MKAKGIFYNEKYKVFYFEIEGCVGVTVLRLKIHIKLNYGANFLINSKDSTVIVEHANEEMLRHARDYVRSLG